MKKLYLVRHAKSSHDNNTLPDIERTLNKRGLRDAPYMAKLMKKKGVTPTLFISSPAVRALTTAKLFAAEMNYNKEEILIDPVLYSFIADQILAFIAETQIQAESVMLFSHNPTITEIVNFFTGEQIFSMPTCAIAAIQFDVEKWSEVGYHKGKLIFMEYPKLHKDKLGEVEDD